MFEISRRSLLRTGIVLTASSVLSRRGWGSVLPCYQDTSVEAPREKLLFGIGWNSPLPAPTLPPLIAHRVRWPGVVVTL